MEVQGGTDRAPVVVVDYAHTPDALAKVLAALRSYCSGRLICVVGCGGDRDKGKRPQMGECVTAAADTTWVMWVHWRWVRPWVWLPSSCVMRLCC